MHLSITAPNLIPRGIFSGGSDNNGTCRSYDQDTAAEPMLGSLTFHKLMTYISLGAMAVCCLSVGLITIGHIFTYRVPRIQKNLIRIILTAPVFAICSALGLISYRATAYITPWAELYEAFGLIAVLLLMTNLLTPLARTWQDQLTFFADPANGGPAAFAKTNKMVFQLLPVRIILTIATVVVAAVDCVGGKTYHRANLVISIINGISTVLALISLFMFLRRHIRQLIVHDPKIVGKLACFKLIVAVQFIQRIVLSILTQANVLNPTATMSYDDLNLGLGAFLTTIEATLIGLAMVWYYWHGQFRHEQQVESNKHSMLVAHGVQNEQKISPLKAIWSIINLTDVFQGIFRAIKAHAQRRRGGQMQTYQQYQQSAEVSAMPSQEGRQYNPYRPNRSYQKPQEVRY